MARTLPVILTASDWDKKKGTIAKITKETGIGAQLKKVESAYKVIDWTAFDVATVLKRAKTAKDIDDAIDDAKDEHGSKVEKLRDELVKTRDLARKTAKEFEKSKMIPKSTTAATLAIGTSADEYYIELKSMDSEYNAMIAGKGKLTPSAVSEAKCSEIMGSAYFDALKKISLSSNAIVKAFSSDAAFAKSPVDASDDADSSKWQTTFAKEVKTAETIRTKLLSLESKVMKISEMKKLFPEATSTLYDAFHVMKPGLRGCLGEWTTRQGTLARESSFDLKTAKTFKIAEKLGTYLQDQEVHIMAIDNICDKIRFA